MNRREITGPLLALIGAGAVIVLAGVFIVLNIVNLQSAASPTPPVTPSQVTTLTPTTPAPSTVIAQFPTALPLPGFATRPPLSCSFQAQTAGLTVTFLSRTVGVDSFFWNFGNGVTSTQANPSVSYAAPGNYTVTLTCGGGGTSLTSSLTLALTANAATVPFIADFSANPASGTAPLTVQFFDNSTGGAISAWQWSFGDGGSSTQQNPVYTYNSAGVYSVTLTVQSADGRAASVSRTVEAVPPQPLIPAFDVAPQSGFAPLAVVVTDRTQGTVNTWAWDWGDGTTGSGFDPGIHTYQTPGVYTILLTVSGPSGTAQVTNLVTVNALVQNAATGASSFQTTSINGLTLCFSSTLAAGFTLVGWDFGDNAISVEANPCHTYAAPGQYEVVLILNGAQGEVSLRQTFTVSAAPTATVATSTSTASATPTNTPTPTATATFTVTPSATSSAAASIATSATATFTAASTDTATATATETPTFTPTFTETATETPTETPLKPQRLPKQRRKPD
ncbi:MAG: PKD domain-containing protein [Anaerolineae bacterium]